MKGFGIEIKNDLLDPKHVEQMDIAVWLYMWLIDHMTSIGEDGLGLVLGGKPITYSDVHELGISERTYSRWVSILKKSGYILTTRRPNGLTIKVNKAHKWFGKRYAKNGVSPDTPKVAAGSVENGVSDTPETADAHIQYSRQSKDNSKAKISFLQGKDWNLLIDAFAPVNPMYTDFYKNKTERRALDQLAAQFGTEKMLRTIQALPDIVSQPFAPKITKPTELRRDFGKLIAFVKQAQTGKTKYAVGVV